MKKVHFVLLTVAIMILAGSAWAVQGELQTDAATEVQNEQVLTDPSFPMFSDLSFVAEINGWGPGACAVIRPLANHSDCNFSLCESVGCGAPTGWDPVDCSCTCGWMF